MKNCSICNLEFPEEFELTEAILDGVDDIYHVELCDSCNDTYIRDYHSPEDISKLFSNIEICDKCNAKVHLVGSVTIIGICEDLDRTYKVCSNCYNKYSMYREFGGKSKPLPTIMHV